MVKTKFLSRRWIGGAIAGIAIVTALAVVSAALAGTAPATAPATMPMLGTADLALLHQLASGTWRERRDAETQLVGRGPDADAVVRAMLAQSTDPEAKSRLNAVLAQWSQEKLNGPSLITLHLKNAPAKTAYAELFLQAGASFSTPSENLFDTTAPVSLDADSQPFWVVMQKLEQLTKIGFVRELDGRCRLTRGNLVAAGPQALAGQFLIVATSARMQPVTNVPAVPAVPVAPGVGKVFQLQLMIYPEPKTYVLPVRPKLEVGAATDNHDNVVREATEGTMTYPGTIDQSRYFAAMELGTKNPGDRLSRFRATLSLTVACSTHHVEIGDVMHAAQPVFDVGGIALKFGGCTKAGQFYTVTLTSGPDTTGICQQFTENPRAAMHLYDTHDRELPLYSTESGMHGAGCDIGFQFNAAVDPAHPKRGELVPQRIAWELPEDIHSVKIPIDFENMNLTIDRNQ